MRSDGKQNTNDPFLQYIYLGDDIDPEQIDIGNISRNDMHLLVAKY